jgi:hypothetical protein
MGVHRLFRRRGAVRCQPFQIVSAYQRTAPGFLQRVDIKLAECVGPAGLPTPDHLGSALPMSGPPRPGRPTPTCRCFCGGGAICFRRGMAPLGVPRSYPRSAAAIVKDRGPVKSERGP